MSATQSGGAVVTPEQRGREIFEEADARNSGYGDLEVELQMILRTARGVATQRDLRIRQLEVPEDGDKVLVVFDAPADIRGTALLSHAHKIADDDQWLYLPAIKRVKKISTRNRSSAFVGSEFSFEDLALPELDKYRYRYLRDEDLDGQPCFVIERISIAEYSSYSRELYWLDMAEYRTLRVEYYDERETPEKILKVTGYARHQDQYWKAGRMLMENLRSGRSTELLWRNYQFGLGLGAERNFSVASLRRAR